jgi:hypothetical protein
LVSKEKKALGYASQEIKGDVLEKGLIQEIFQSDGR